MAEVKSVARDLRVSPLEAIGHRLVAASSPRVTINEIPFETQIGLRGDASNPFIWLALLLGLFAIDNWRRLPEDDDLLPRRFRCPECDTPIRLSAAERRRTTFSCDACGEHFQVD